MPWGDGTGPSWAQGRGWRCWRASGYPAFGRGFYGRRFYLDEPVEPIILTKEEQKKVLEAELKEIEVEKQEIENKLKEMG
jgi:hypothetical protein